LAPHICDVLNVIDEELPCKVIEAIFLYPFIYIFETKRVVGGDIKSL
jgi:hypothetical protein